MNSKDIENWIDENYTICSERERIVMIDVVKRFHKEFSSQPSTEKEEEKKCSPLEHESGLTHSGQCLICGEKSF